MKFTTPLDSVFDRSTKVRLLRALLIAPGRQWTGRELARGAGISASQAARDLQGLSDAGVVAFNVVGRSFVWKLNLENPLYPVLSHLFEREASLRTDLLRELSLGLTVPQIRRARVFGSVARGEEREDSDIDVFVEAKGSAETPLIEEAIERTRERVWRKFGNPLAPLVYSGSRVRRPPNPALMTAIERDGLDVLDVPGA